MTCYRDGFTFFFYIKIQDYEICHKRKDIRGNGDTENRRLKDNEERNVKWLRN